MLIREEIRIIPNLYNKTKLHQDTVIIINIFLKLKYATIVIKFSYREIAFGFVENSLYIGVSTLSCSDRALVLNDKDIKFRGTHGVSYHSYIFQKGTQEHLIEETETKYEKGYKILKETIILNHNIKS